MDLLVSKSMIRDLSVLDTSPFLGCHGQDDELNHHVCVFSSTAFSLHVVVLERRPWILMLEFERSRLVVLFVVRSFDIFNVMWLVCT